MEATSTNKLFPIFLKAGNLPILIVGGGDAGSEKLRFLMKSSPDAQVTLVAKEMSEEILALKRKHPHINLFHRAFQPNDLESIKIAIIATDDHDLNKKIRDMALKAGILTNVADTPNLCEFYLGSIVTKGDLKIGISTNGKSPTFAKRFRQVLEDTLPDSLPEVLYNLREIRKSLTGDFRDKIIQLNQITKNLVNHD